MTARGRAAAHPHVDAHDHDHDHDHGGALVFVIVNRARFSRAGPAEPRCAPSRKPGMPSEHARSGSAPSSSRYSRTPRRRA
jgi:hypothetical protein